MSREFVRSSSGVLTKSLPRLGSTFLVIFLISACLYSINISTQYSSDRDEETLQVFESETPSSEYGLEEKSNKLSLKHLARVERELITDAISNSGLELQSDCESKVHTESQLAAFFGTWDVVEESADFQPSSYKYPYPFSESKGIARTIPVELSTVSIKDSQDDRRVTYSAQPAASLYDGLSEEDKIFELEDLVIEFTIDLSTRRLSSMELKLIEPTEVYFGITIQELQMQYSFEYVSEVDAVVVTSLFHRMKGNLWLIFRPWFEINETYSYRECESLAHD